MPFLSDESRRDLDALRSLDAAEQAPALARISGIRALLSALEDDPATLTAVRDALAADMTWDEVADAAGIGVAAAKWRWQGADQEIAARHEAGRKRSARPSSVPNDLPGLSVADAAKKLDLTVQAVYLRISRGQLESQTVELPDGRKYKRVMLG